MKLAAWMKERQFSYREAADAMKINRMSLHHVLSGRREPTWRLIEKILIGTKGAVTPNDFVKKWPKGCKP